MPCPVYASILPTVRQFFPYFLCLKVFRSSYRRNSISGTKIGIDNLPA
jgi:hypothetical protein